MTKTQRAAMQQALEFCEELQGGCTDSDDGTVDAITVWCPELISALRAALAEPEPEPVEAMSDKKVAAMQQALKALEKCKAALAEELAAWDIDPPLRHVLEASNSCGPSIAALRAALAEPERSELRERTKRARQAALIEAAEICDRHANEWPQTIAAVLRATAKEKGND